MSGANTALPAADDEMKTSFMLSVLPVACCCCCAAANGSGWSSSSSRSSAANDAMPARRAIAADARAGVRAAAGSQGGLAAGLAAYVVSCLRELFALAGQQLGLESEH